MDASSGLYQLYFNQDLQLPKWLKIDTLDDLKSKLVGVVVAVLAVFFLGKAEVWSSGSDIMYLGAGIAVMIAALTYLLSKIGAWPELQAIRLNETMAFLATRAVTVAAL